MSSASLFLCFVSSIVCLYDRQYWVYPPLCLNPFIAWKSLIPCCLCLQSLYACHLYSFSHTTFLGILSNASAFFNRRYINLHASTTSKPALCFMWLWFSKYCFLQSFIHLYCYTLQCNSSSASIKGHSLVLLLVCIGAITPIMQLYGTTPLYLAILNTFVSLFSLLVSNFLTLLKVLFVSICNLKDVIF